MHYKINEPEVAHHEINQEIIIIHLESGYYYNLNRSGTILWKLLLEGCPANEIENHLKAPLPKGFTQAFEKLLQTLIQENILIAQENAAPFDSSPNQDIIVELPVCDKFTDMEELIKADPIHDVKAEGWPHKKPNTFSDD